MEIAPPLAGTEAPVDSPLKLFSFSSISHELRAALERSFQIAFDWCIEEGKLHFGDILASSIKGVLLHTGEAASCAALRTLIHPEDKENFCQMLGAALLSDHSSDSSIYKMELRLLGAIGKWRWVELSCKIIARDRHGHATRIAGSLSDIDERKQSELKMTKLRDLHVALSQINQTILRINDRDLLFAEVCRIIVKPPYIVAAWIGAIESTKSPEKPVAGRGRGLHQLQRAGSPAKIDDAVYNDALHAPPVSHMRDVLSRYGIRSTARFHFKLSGKPYGSLNLYAAEPNFFDAETIALIEEITRDISFAVDKQEREARRIAMEAVLADSERIKSAILTAALDCIVSIDHEGNIISFNHAAELTFGHRSEDVVGKRLADVMVPHEWREHHLHGIAHFNASGKGDLLNRRIELTALHADGKRFPIELAIVPLRVNDKPIFTAFIRDISERKRTEALQYAHNHILNMVATGAPLKEILVAIARFAEQHLEDGVCSIHHIDSASDELQNCVAPSLPNAPQFPLLVNGSTLPGRSGDTLLSDDGLTIMDLSTAPWYTEERALAATCELKACSSWPIFGKQKKVVGRLTFYFRKVATLSAWDLQLSSLCRDLAGIAIESRVSEEKIRHLAHHDGLTGLPNRFLFSEYLDIALRNANRYEKKFAVFFIDLDKFKEINDTFGHDAGDQVLREISKRLRSSLRVTDRIARMGGDEFYVLIEELTDGQYAAHVAQKLLDVAARPFIVRGEERQISISIGIAIYPDDGINGQSLLRNADAAMYRAKDLGKNAYQFHSTPSPSAPEEPLVLRRIGAPPKSDKKWMRMN